MLLHNIALWRQKNREIGFKLPCIFSHAFNATPSPQTSYSATFFNFSMNILRVYFCLVHRRGDYMTTTTLRPLTYGTRMCAECALSYTQAMKNRTRSSIHQVLLTRVDSEEARRRLHRSKLYFCIFYCTSPLTLSILTY